MSALGPVRGAQVGRAVRLSCRMSAMSAESTSIQAPTTPAPGEAAPTRARAEARPWIWRPNLLVFLSNACVMILELVAGRIIAPYVGVSLYTWTSVIGVILAGISLGNYLGGRLADRWASLRLLGGVYLLGGLSSFIILTVDLMADWVPYQWSIVWRILALTAALFVLPSAVLGCISPIVAKLAVQDLARTGRTVGMIYASGAAGSIVGTFATGFFLISWFGTYAIVLGVAVVLLGLGFALLLTGKPRALGASFMGSLALAGVIWWPTHSLSPCTLETDYFCIKVREENRHGDIVRLLILDRLVHSYSSLSDPTRLVYGYEQVYAEATQYQAQRNATLSALFIGGGGYTFPRYMENVYPGSRLDVIEIDPAVTRVAYEYMGLPADSTVTSFNQDARLFLEREPDHHYNLIMGDAFNDYSVPYHLTTHEFNQRVRAWLADHGLYLVNIIDGAGGDFLRAYTHTLRQSFEHVYVIPTTENWRWSVRTTYVLVAGRHPLDLEAFKDIDGGDGSALLAHRVLSQEELDEVLAGGRTITLTDRYAPVDQLLAAVVRDELPEGVQPPTPTPEFWDQLP
ncbi:MAG: fused MFS/spermidine synthase [Anaerolineae bacterium]|nr:fused MFS/spermidine synthase [Anaerolineae bacterium]